MWKESRLRTPLAIGGPHEENQPRTTRQARSVSRAFSLEWRGKNMHHAPSVLTARLMKLG